MIISKPNQNGANYGGSDLALDSSGVFSFSVREATVGVDFCNGTTVVSTGVWYHVAGVKSTTNMKIYVNGIEENNCTQSVSDPVTNSTMDHYVGAVQSA